jgi:hypothetical protein
MPQIAIVMVNNGQEITNGTNPPADSEHDGVNDGQEGTDGTQPIESRYGWRWSK